MRSSLQDKTAKGDRARKRILETASAMMAEKGPDGVSMRELSLRLKVTKPVIYYYFKNKAELIRAAFIEGTKHFNELNTLINDPRLTLEQRLARIFSNHLDFIRRYPDMPKCALKIMASPSSGVLGAMAMDLKRRNRKALKAMLETVADKEGLSGAGIATVLHMVSAVIGYFMIEARESGAQSMDKGLPGRLAKTVCAGARTLAVLLFTLTAAAPGASALDLTMDDAVRTALKNNATVVTAEGTRLIYKEKIKEYWGTVFPQLSANGQYTRNIKSPSFFLGSTVIKIGLNNVYAGSLDLSQVLWAGGKVHTGIRMANMYAADSDEQLKTARNGVSKAVKQMYYSVLLSSSFASIQRESLDLARQHLATIEAQYRQGVASDLAVLRQTWRSQTPNRP
jgi:AcrR family transcriptional regulator